MIVDRLRVPVADFEAGSGWRLEPEGACRGDLCVPLPDDAIVDGVVDVPTVADRLGMPLVEDADVGLWAVGPAARSGHALASAEAPEVVLPTVDGEPFRLSSLRGQKVVLVAWAPF